MLKNIGSNWTYSVVQILVFLVLTPYTLGALNETADGTFGIWETIVATAGPLQLLILGVPMATVRAISGHVAKGEYTEANRALGASLSLTIGLGCVALLLGGLVFWLGDQLFQGWELGPERLADARQAILLVVFNLAIGFALRLPYAAYDAHLDFIPRNLVMGGGLLAKLGLTILLLEWRASLSTLALVQVLITLLEFDLATVVLKLRHPELHIRPHGLDWPRAKSILSFSLFAMLLNMGALLAFRLDALVVGFHLDEVEVQVYALGNKIFDPFINLLLAIGMVIMPMAAGLKAKGQAAEVGAMLLKWSKVAFSLVLMIGGYLMVLGPEFLARWLEASYTPEVGRLMQVLMLSFFLFLPVRGVALPLLMGLGQARAPAFGLLAMGLCNLLLSMLLIRDLGLMGVALGTAIPNVVFGYLIVRMACQELGQGLFEYLRYGAGRSLVGMLPGLGLLSGIKLYLEPRGYPLLVASGIGYVLLFGVTQVFFVYRGDRHLDLHAALLQRLGRAES